MSVFIGKKYYATFHFKFIFRINANLGISIQQFVEENVFL